MHAVSWESNILCLSNKDFIATMMGQSVAHWPAKGEKKNSYKTKCLSELQLFAII